MNKKLSLIALAAGALLVTLPSCIDDDDSTDALMPTALVTVCPSVDGSFVMQLDDNTQLVPVNLSVSPFGTKEVRALVNYTDDNVTSPNQTVRNVRVYRLDSIRTKLPVKTLGSQDKDKYGNDPIEIVQDWLTVAEDGYLTLRIRTLWGDQESRHAINLVTGINPDDPFEFELRHDANGDTEDRWGDALVAFNLNGLPRPDSGTAKIKLKWESFSGEKTTEFDIKLRPL